MCSSFKVTLQIKSLSKTTSLFVCDQQYYKELKSNKHADKRDGELAILGYNLFNKGEGTMDDGQNNNIYPRDERHSHGKLS